jgi:2-polyprenyl-3-methyl-5-hydroxy-6-metoxy-1,4-benzoquinol methylase
MGALNDGALCLMTSIGHRTGLFDTLASMDSGTSHEIAEKASLNERYVREWLGAMVTSRVVDCDPDSLKYSLPQEHASFLSSEVSPDNIAVFTQYIPVLANVEDDIVDCFRNGGGVPYSRFSRFHEVMADDSAQSVLSALFDHILPLVPNISEDLDGGISVMDVGCGSGRAVNRMAERYPNSSFVGLDLSEEAIETATADARDRNITNARFQVQDLSTFADDAESEAYDFVTAFDAIHDQARPRSVLKGIYRSLKPGGTFLMQDIRGSGHHHGDLDHPIGPFLYTISTMHCMTVSLAQNGEGLGAMWGEKLAKELLNEAGFARVEVNQLEHDFQNSFYVMQK